MNIDALKLYLVTDEHDHLLERVERALEGGVTCVQLRRKKRSTRQLLDEAKQLKKLCQHYQVPLIINDRADIAVLCDADGLHLGQSDLPVQEARKIVGENMWIGVTAKTVEQAIQAEQEGANYLGVGAIFPSPTKKDTVVLPEKDWQAIIRSVSIPSVLIGGITLDTFPQIKNKVPAGVAVVSAIMSANDPQEAASAFRKQLG